MIEVTLTGNLGRDCEQRTIKGKLYNSFSVGAQVNKETFMWVSVLQYTTPQSTLKDYLKKGTRVLCVGDLKVATYTGKDGSTRVDVTCDARRVELLGSKQDAQAQAQPQTQPKEPSSNPENDLPF